MTFNRVREGRNVTIRTIGFHDREFNSRYTENESLESFIFPKCRKKSVAEGRSEAREKYEKRRKKRNAIPDVTRGIFVGGTSSRYQHR